MKKFIVAFLWFTLPAAILAFPADWLVSKILKSSNNYASFEYPVWNAIFEGKIKANVFIYGSSRAWTHIDPQMIEDSLKATAYNFGVDGHNFKLQYLRHTMLEKYNRRPKVIIHSVDMFTLSKQKDLYNYEQFLPYMLYNGRLENTLLSYNGFEPMDFKIPMLRYLRSADAIRESIGQATGLDKNKPYRKKGFHMQEENWNGEFEKVKDKLKALSVPLDPEMIVLFDQYLQDCQQKNIKVILIYTPEYIEGQQFETNRREIINRYRNWAKKYGMLYLDYSKDPVSYDKKYFFNATHLNKTGAVLFNAKLVRDLKKSGVALN